MRRRGLILLAFVTSIAATRVVYERCFTFRCSGTVEFRSYTQCNRHLRDIAAAIQGYQSEFDGNYPARLGDLVAADRMSAAQLVCPGSTDTPAAQGPTTRATGDNIHVGGHISYVYLAAGQKAPLSVHFIVAYEPPGDHPERGMPMLYACGVVEWFKGDRAA